MPDRSRPGGTLLRETGRLTLMESETRERLRKSDIPLVDAAVARTEADAVRQAEARGYPVVLKVMSRDIVHKAAAGCVAMQLCDEQSVRSGYQRILAAATAHASPRRIEGVLVARMIAHVGELFVGWQRNATFGPTVLLGIGGVALESTNLVQARLVPADNKELWGCAQEVRGFVETLNWDGMDRWPSLFRFVQRLTAYCKKSNDVLDVEFNPIVPVASEGTIVALDAHMTVLRPS